MLVMIVGFLLLGFFYYVIWIIQKYGKISPDSTANKEAEIKGNKDLFDHFRDEDFLQICKSDYSRRLGVGRSFFVVK